MTSLQPVGFEDSYRQVPWPSRLHHGSMALLAKASPSSPERVDGKLTNSSSVKVLILAAPDAALAPLCVSTSAYCATEPTPARKRTNRLKPDLYDTPSTPTPSKTWMAVPERTTNPFDAEPWTFPSAPPSTTLTTTPAGPPSHQRGCRGVRSITPPPRPTPWPYGSALNSSPWLFRRLSRVERPATAPRHPPSLRLPATFPSLALIEVTIGNTPGTGRCSLAVTHAPTTPISHLGGPPACKRDQGAVARTPEGILG